MAGVKRLFVDGRYGQVHLRVANQNAAGTPLVLLHMLPQSGRMFDPLFAAMGETCPIIAPDFPGYGESSGPCEPIGVADYAASIWEALDALSTLGLRSPYHFFGIHGGAKMAVEVTLQRPSQVDRLIVSSLALLEGEDQDQIRKTFSPIPLDFAGTRFEALWEVVMRSSLPDITLAQAAQAFAEMLRPGENYTWANIALLEYNAQLKDKLDQLEHHVDLINPSDTLFEYTRAMQHKLPNVTYHEKRHWRLMFAQSHADELAQLLKSVLALKHDLPVAQSG